jgi:hypothetical protein
VEDYVDAAGHSLVYVGVDDRLAGLFAIEDPSATTWST